MQAAQLVHFDPEFVLATNVAIETGRTSMDWVETLQRVSLFLEQLINQDHRSHFIRENGGLFRIDYLPEFAKFRNHVHLQVTETRIHTRNTHSDASNESISDDCLCYLDNANLIVHMFKLIFTRSPINYVVIPTLCLIFFTSCFACQFICRK